MAAEDFIIRIVLDAQSKIAPVMASAAAEADKLRDRFRDVDRAAGSLDKRLDQLEGHVSKARDTMRSMNPTLDALDRKLGSINRTTTGINRNFGVLERNSGKAAAALGGLSGVVGKLEKKLNELDLKMTEMGARTYEPKLEVAGTEKAEAKVNALIGKLASASRGQWTAKTDVEIGAAIAKVEALRKELESLGAGDRARKLILDIEIEHWEDFDAKMAAAEAAKRKLEGGTHVRIDDSEVDALIFKLASETAKRHTFKTDVETAAAERGIERLRLKLHELGQGSRADNLILDIETRLDQAQIVTDAKAALAEAKAATREGFSFHAFLETGQFNKDFNEARAKLFELAGIDVKPSVHLGIAEFEAERLIVEEQLLRLGLKRETIKVVLDYDRGNWRNVIGALQEQFQQASENIKSSSEVTLRGIINGAINAAILFAEPLLSALTAVAGGLIAMGVAAGQAVAALAGLATAAVAQGVPALGILAVAFQRVSAVMKVSQLLQTERDKGAQQSIGIDKSRANALDAVRAAHEGVANAQRNLIDTQKRLTEARQQGIRTLNDMILAEQRSQLTAQQSRLTTAIAAATGDTSGLFQERQLSTQADQRTANRDQVDTKKAVAGGVEGLPQVQAAAKAVADAQRALAAAERQVASAARGLDAAGAKIGAAASAYEIALGKLSGGERKLLSSIERIKGAFRDTNGEIRGVSDIITVSLANALDRVAKMFSDPAILRAFTGLAKSIGASIDTLAKFFTSGPLKGALIFFTNEASRNFGPLTKIITGLISVLVDVAKAASGPLHDALNGVAGFFERIHKSAGSPEGQKNMRKFFDGGLDAMKSFLDLGGSIINLFLALAGPGGASEEGVNGIDRLAAAINRAADYIENNQTKVHAFFRDAINGSADVARVIIALGKFLVKTFDPKSLSEFSKFIRQVVLPVLAGFVIGLGAIVRGLLAISNSTAGSDILKLAGVFIGLRFVLLRVRGLFYDIGGLILKLPGLFAGFGRGMLGFYRLITLSQDSMILLRLSILKTAIAQGIQTVATKVAAGATKAWAAAQWLLNAAMDANPIGLIIIAIAAVGAAFYLAYTKLGFFHRAVDAVFSWIKDHWKLVLVLITGPIGLAVAAIVKFGPQVLGLFKDAFGGVMDWVKDHWKAIIGIVGGPLGAIILVIEKFGGKIFGPFKKAFETIKGYARTVWNDIKKIFGGGGTNDGPQQGGLPTSPGSPKITTDPLGLGPTGFKPATFNTPGGGFHDSISNAGPATNKPKPKKKNDPLSFEDTLSASESKITPQEAEKIKTLWAGILQSTKEKTAGISKAVRDMRVAIEATLKRLTRVGSDDFDDLWKNSRHSMGNLATSVDVQLKNVARSFKDSMKSVTETVYDAFSYIDTQVGKSLKALGGDPIKLTIDKPPTERRAEGGFAGAGWVGMKGERGGDTVRALIGRGEAVLNYAHQRVVEPAMQYFYGYGLSDMFKRNRAEHAGLNSGYASGGFVNSPGAHIDTPAEKSIAGRLGRLGKKLGITFSPASPRSARRTPSENVAVGGAQGSNHLLGRAMDVAPDAIKTIANSILNSFGLNRPMPGNWIGTDGKVHDERNHIELLGTAISSAVNAFVDTTIKKIKVNGPDGALKSLASRAITKVRTAANTQLSGAETVGLTGPTASAAGGGGVVPGILAIARHAAFLNKVKWDERLTRILLQKESGGGKNLPPHNYGGILDPAGPFQIISSTFAANAFKGHGNRMNPEDNALAAFHYIKARYGSLANLARTTGLLGDNYQGYKHGGFVGAIQQFAKGGVVQGAIGKAVPVVAHGGELILNKIQQSKLGQMLAIGGFARDESPQERYLRILREEDERRRKAKEGESVDPKTLAIGLAFPAAGALGSLRGRLGAVARFAAPALDKSNYDAGRTGPAIGGGRLVHSSVPQHAPEPPPLSHFAQEEIKKRSKIKKAPYKGFKQRVFAAGGFNDEQPWDWGGWQKDGGTYLVNRPTLFGAGENGPEIAHFATGKSGSKFKGPNPAKVFGSGLDDLATDFAPVDGLTDLLKKVFKSVGKLADGGKKSLSRLANAFDVFGTDATNPFKLLEAAIADRAKLAARRLKQQIFRVSPTGRGERRQISAQTSGAIELGILNQSRDSYEDEAKVNAGALKDAQQALKGAKTKKQKQAFQAQVNRLVNQRGAIQDALADNAQAIVERQEQMQREILDASNKYFDGLRAGIDRARRIADALGTGGETGRIDQTVKIAKDQIADLSGQLKDAKKNGNQELATQIQAQIDELNTSVVELGAQRLQAVVDDINKNAEKSLGNNDLKQKFASFGITQEQAQKGTFNIAALGRTDFAAQGQALNERGDILKKQREDLAGQLAQASKDGNVKVTEALTKQMNDLDVSIVENTVAIRDNTQAAFQAAVDSSHTMSDFLLSVNQGQTGILTALGLDPNGSLQQRGGILQGAISSDKGFLAKLFNDTPGGVGIDPTVLAGIGPEGLAPFLTGKYSEAVASGKYSDPQLEAMRNLINGLLGNTQALIENTNALSPDNTQNFSSTAWTVFRRAIFDGSGGLLPQFQLPHMDVGGLITKSGPIYAHAGEVITPYHERMSGSRGDTNVNVNIKESDQVNDPVALANRIAYTIKTER